MRQLQDRQERERNQRIYETVIKSDLEELEEALQPTIGFRLSPID